MTINPSIMLKHKPVHSFTDKTVKCSQLNTLNRTANPTYDTNAFIQARIKAKSNLTNNGLWVYDKNNRIIPSNAHNIKELTMMVYPNSTTGADAEHNIRKYYNDVWFNKLTDRQRYALTWYCDYGYASMNAFLDGRNPMAYDAKQYCDDAMSAMMLTKPLANDVIMYRRIMTDDKIKRPTEELKLYNTLATSSIMVRKSFTSTSMVDGVFNHDDYSDTCIIMRVHAGVRGFAVPSDVRNVGIDEHEFILAPGSHIMVNDVLETSPLADNDGLTWAAGHPVIIADVLS